MKVAVAWFLSVVWQEEWYMKNIHVVDNIFFKSLGSQVIIQI